MTRKDNSAEGGTDGVQVSTSNSGGASGTAWDLVSVGSGTTFHYIAAGAIRGSLSIHCSSSTAANIALAGWDDTASASVSTRFYIKFSTLPNATQQVGVNIRGNAAATSLARTEMDSTGHIRCVCGGSSPLTTAALSTGTTYMIQLICTGLGTASSAATVNLFQADGTTLIESETITGQTTSFQADNTRFGKFNGASNFDCIIEDTAANIGTSVAIGAVPTNIAPTANAGSDQVDIEAYKTATVTGSDNDTDGTVVTRTWRVISTTNGAPTPTLSGTGNTRTFKAPGAVLGTTVTLGYKVTDNGGLDSTEDTMTVAVLPVTERAVIGGVEVPMEVQAIGP